MDVRGAEKLGADSYILDHMRVAWVLGVTAAITAAQQIDEARVSAHLYTPPQPHISTLGLHALPGGCKMAVQNQTVTISK